ncbi:High affinity copper uptake protein 1 [Eumeta japonica]|uniref:Copper transport protein n=1 Tax=Eumeta variegata TaxID=151549 RepID=A0A4C1T119_EUMVA|nr:High affinity copper uptake protein 1 [Eumeta japonica]
MHMWMWSGYSLGEFLFPNLNITTRWSFALTWIVLFLVALLFEGSKVYLTHVQKEAHRKFLPTRSDERRNLLCDREHGGRSSVTHTQPDQGPQRTSIKMRLLVTFHQTVLFIIHNTVGYLLMLVVMLYNVYLILAVVFGMTLGYFLFGSKLVRIKMRCFVTKRVVICTPECDDTAEEIPQHINSATTSESELFVCETRTCITPSHYYRASTSQDGASSDQSNVTCQYGAKRCPSKISKIRNAPTPGPSKQCHMDSELKNNTSVEDVKLLRTIESECCRSQSNESKCCNKTASRDHPVVLHAVEDQHNKIENCDGTNAADSDPDLQYSHSLNV